MFLDLSQTFHMVWLHRGLMYKMSKLQPASYCQLLVILSLGKKLQMPHEGVCWNFVSDPVGNTSGKCTRASTLHTLECWYSYNRRKVRRHIHHANRWVFGWRINHFLRTFSPVGRYLYNQGLINWESVLSYVLLLFVSLRIISLCFGNILCFFDCKKKCLPISHFPGKQSFINAY